MKICCISDMHNRHWDLEMPEADVLVVAGDITEEGTNAEIIDFNQWLGTIKDKYQKIICIAGNHDFGFQIKGLNSKSFLTNAIYLQDSGYEWRGVRFWGSPHQPWFGGWAFNAYRGPDIDQHWEKIPKDTDILITHSPPYGTLDLPSRVYCSSDPHCGCDDLRYRISKLDNLKANIFGHIHHSHGMVEKEGIQYVNASSAPHPKSKLNKPIIIEVN